MNENWRDAFDAKVDTCRWYGTAYGREWMSRMLQVELAEMTEQGAIALLRAAYVSEEERLAGATPFFVSRDMCELVEHAAESFEPEPVYPTDLLEMQGFVYFERPFKIPDRYGRDVTIKGISWQPVMDQRGAEVLPDRVLSREDEMREWLEQRHSQGLIDGLMITLYSDPDFQGLPKDLPTPSMLPLHMTPWWWGMTFEGNEITTEGRPSGAEWWWRVLQVTLRLMQQQITVRRNERPYRQRRREAERYGVYPSDVCVVTLRRERHDGTEPSGEEANYSHRFMVGGHWRNQWYPSAGIHRQIYIAPYVKGPEDKPLIIKPRAYAWTR